MKNLIDIDFNEEIKSKVLTQEEIELKEIKRKEENERELKLKEQFLRSWVEQVFECYNDPEKLYQVFYIWADSFGFKNEKWFDSISRLIQRGNYKGFINYIKEQYLNSFSDCNKKQRGIKVKKIKYQFEKNPRSLYRTKIEGSILSESKFKRTIELTDYGKEQIDIQNSIDSFILKMNS
jgi:hypothetical protein